VDGDVGDAELQRLKIGVDGHELDPGHVRVDHPVDRVDAGTADADNPDNRLMRLPTSRRLVLRFLPPVPRSLGSLFSSRNGLLRKDPLQPFRRRFGRLSFTRRRLIPLSFRRLSRGWRRGLSLPRVSGRAAPGDRTRGLRP
jgi:hypothetical protein